MNNQKSLFDDLDFDELTVPEKPKAEEPEKKTATKEEITDAVKKVVEDIKPAIIENIENIEDIFSIPQAREDEAEELDDNDYLKKTTLEKLTTEGRVVIDGMEVYLEAVDEEDEEYYVHFIKKEGEESEKVSPDTMSYEDALELATDHILKLTQKPSKKAKPSSKKKAPAPPKEVEPPYTGPRIIKVWGRELWTENDPSVTEEEIKERIARDFGFPEFRSGNVVYVLDKDSGVLSVGLSFNKKG